MNVNEDLLSDMSYKIKNCIITVNYKQQPPKITHLILQKY